MSLVRAAVVVAVAENHSRGEKTGGGKKEAAAHKTKRALLGAPTVAEASIAVINILSRNERPEQF